MTTHARFFEIRVMALDRDVGTIFRRFVSPAFPAEQQLVLDEVMEINATIPSTLTMGLNPRTEPRSGVGWVDRVEKIAVEVDPGRAEAVTRLMAVLQQLAPAGRKAFDLIGTDLDHAADVVIRLDPGADPDDAWIVARRLEIFSGSKVTTEPHRAVPIVGSMAWIGFVLTPTPVVMLVEADDTTTLAEIDAALDAVGADPISDEERASRPRRRLLPSAVPLAQNQLDALVTQLPGWAKRLTVEGWRKGGRYGTRDAADLAVIKHFLFAGLDDGQIAWLWPQLPIGAASRHRSPRYLPRTIDMARGTGEPPCTIRVNGWRYARTPSRVELLCTVEDGEHEGTRIVQGVTLTSSAAPHAFRSLGVELETGVTDAGEITDVLDSLNGRTALGRLKPYRSVLHVKDWMIRLPEPEGPYPLLPSEIAEAGTVLEEIRQRGMPIDGQMFAALSRSYRTQLIDEYRGGNLIIWKNTLAKLATLASHEAEILRQAPFGRVRVGWWSTDAAGRIHAHQVAVQQVKRELRAAFVAPPGKVIVTVDWSSCQPRILAALSGDPALLAAFAPGAPDLYRQLGQTWAPGAEDPRKVGKRLLLPLVFLAKPPKLVQRAAEAGVDLELAQAVTLRDAFDAQFAQLVAWRESWAEIDCWTSPRGRRITMPTDENRDKRLRRTIARVAQAVEADALRLVIERAEGTLAETGAEIIMPMHDAVVVEARADVADDVAERVQALMIEALEEVCPGTRGLVVADSEIGATWGGG